MSDSEWPLPPLSLVRESLKFCRCCPSCAADTPPCTGSMVTGICDHQRCSCGDDPDDYNDEYNDEEFDDE